MSGFQEGLRGLLYRHPIEEFALGSVCIRVEPLLCNRHLPEVHRDIEMNRAWPASEGSTKSSAQM